MAGIVPQNYNYIEVQVLQEHTADLTQAVATNPSLFGQHLVQHGFTVQITVAGIVDTLGISDYQKGGKLLNIVDSKIRTAGTSESTRKYFDDFLQIVAYTMGQREVAKSIVAAFKCKDPSYTSPLQEYRVPYQQPTPTSSELSYDEPVMHQPESSKKSAMSIEMIRSNEDEISAMFSSLLLKVQSSLEATSKIDDVRQFLLTFFRCSLLETSSYHKLFEEISLKYLWTYQHHSPVEKLINKFLSGDEELKGLMRAYKACLSGFYITTKLVDYMESKKLTVDDVDDESDNQQPPVLSQKQYRRLKVVLMLDRKITELSLEYVYKLWCSFAEEYDIPSLTAVLERVASGSLEITWLIPAHLADKIVPRSSFFRNHGIVRVFLDYELIYDEEEMIDNEASFLELCCIIAVADINEFSGLLKKEVDPNTFELGIHPLINAICAGRQDLVELLIEHGADVDLASKKTGETPLIAAVCSGSYKMVELLLLKGAKVNKTNEKGQSPLWCASRDGQNDIASLLLQHNAEVDLPNNDELGETPLCVACAEGQLNVAYLLLQNGAFVNHETKKGGIPLGYASWHGHTELVDLLLTSQADVNKGAMSPLYGASHDGHIDIAKLLVSHGAKIDIRSDDEFGATPLMAACWENHLDVVSFLIEKGADINLQTKDQGFTPLHTASQRGHTAVVKLLLKSGAQLEIMNKEGRTPLMLASWKGQLETVIELLRREVEANTQDQEGLTSLILAAQNGHLDVVDTLLGANADPDITENTAGWSAMFFAAKSGRLDIVQRLLRQGAKVDIKDKNGLTPSEVTDQQDVREEIKRHYLCQSETEASEEQEMIEVDIQDQPKVIEEKKRRDLVRESYRRLLKIFDVLEDSLLPGRKEKKLHQQAKEMHSNVYGDNQQLAVND